MVEKQSDIRKANSNNAQAEFWAKKPTLLSVFSREESKTLRQILRPYYSKLGVLVCMILLLPQMTLLHRLLLVLTLKSLTVDPANERDYGKFNFQSLEFDIRWISFDDTHMGLVMGMFTLLLGITIVLGIFRFIHSLLRQRIQLTLSRDIRLRVLDKIMTFDLDYFSQAHSGQLIFRMVNETGRFTTLVSYFSDFVQRGIQILGYFLMLYVILPGPTVAIIVGMVLYFFIHLPLDWKMKSRSWQQNRVASLLADSFHQIVYGIKLIRIGGLEGVEREEYRKEHIENETQGMKMTVLRGLSALGQELTIAILLMFAILYTYYDSEMKQILTSPHLFIMYMFLLHQALTAGQGLQKARSSLIGTYGPMTRVMEALQLPDGPVQPNLETTVRTDAPQPIGRLETKNLCFHYGERTAAVENVSIVFQKGQRTALVGFSGSGKSTLLDVLSTVRIPTGGRILIDGTPLWTPENECLKTYKQAVGYVNQEPIVFHDTVRNNVKYFAPHASDDEVWTALRLAAADDFVKRLPDGLDTGMGERGLTISGGERQRIGLARVFLRRYPVLLLDEATNALDYKTEMQVYESLRSIDTDAMIIVAAHRLSAITDFDQIVVMHQGKVVEVGKHADLMAAGGFYAKLFTVQQIQA